MTAREAAIVTAYTGFLIGDFDEAHRYIEHVMDRAVWTHEMGDREFMERVREAAKADFVALSHSVTP